MAVTTDARFQGWWPAAHPRMRSFLGVPIVFRGDVIGAFYLTDKTTGPVFTEADEEMVGGPGRPRRGADEHARLYEQSRDLSVLDERNRLARELHDATTQNLFSLRLSMETAAALVTTDPARATAELDTARDLVDATFAELRALVLELRPPALEADGLVATLRKHLDVAGRAHGLAVALRAAGDEGVPAATERELFRIVQEAVTNVLRHARASTLEVELDFRAGGATITVRDDGVGFDPDARSVRSRRLGLTSMRERARALGGGLAISSSPGAGTTVRVEVPDGRR